MPRGELPETRRGRATSRDRQQRRIFVLDTNVLMHDPTAIFRFDEHDIYIPMIVLEELDAGKKGLSEAARNVRQVSRFLDELMASATKAQIDAGLELPTAKYTNGGKKQASTGRLFFQTKALIGGLPDTLPGHGADNAILGQTLALKDEFPDARVTLVSKDINLRIKAAIIGVHAEDYYSDKTIEDADLLYTGVQELPANFWERHGKNMHSWQEHSRTFYRVQGPMVREWHVNQFLYQKDSNGLEALVRSIDGNGAVMELVRDYRNERHSIWGITARNREQNFALNLLLDPEIDFVTILGPAGTGKTLLTLAAGLAQTLESNRYSEIIMTRVTIPLGEDIGFLPGTEEEKMEPWMGALMDNLEVLTQSQEGGNWGRAATNDLLRNRIKIRSLNFMRGRTFLNRFLILDEAQNLTPKQMKALVTRAGPGTKLVCLGNIAQIDTPYLTETTSGLTYVVNRFRGWAAFRAHHAGARRALAAGGLRVGHPVGVRLQPDNPGMQAQAQTLTQLGQRVAWPESPDEAVLERVPNPHPDKVYLARFTAPEFTSLCPVTGQPDFAHLVIDYVPRRWLVESKSLKLYLGSFRNHGAFHEDCTVAIAGRLVDFLKPRWLRIGGYWYPRGGMPIDVFWQTGRPPAGLWIPDQGVAPYRGRG